MWKGVDPWDFFLCSTCYKKQKKKYVFTVRVTVSFGSWTYSSSNTMLNHHVYPNELTWNPSLDFSTCICVCTIICGDTHGFLIRIQVMHVCVQPSERKTQSAGPIMRRYPTVPLEGGPVMYPQPPPHLLTTPQGAPCYTCIAVPVSSSAAPPRYHGQAQPFYCVNHHLQTLHLDGDAAHHGSNSSSTSDSSSAGHSPPDTPSMPTAPHWESRRK